MKGAVITHLTKPLELDQVNESIDQVLHDSPPALLVIEF